jgi:uncharacterized phage protein (TIGR01671 family)
MEDKMREIKFRAWDKKTKKMRKVDSLAFNDIDGNIKVMNLWGKHIIEDKDIILHREKNVELMQYIGLKDKNGKEIYEGDILLSELHDTDTGEITKDKFIIKFKDGCFFLYIIGTWLTENASITPFLPMCEMGHEYYPCEYEVLGNIYENSELLESED